ncbi:hypothetical protein F0562_001913 [Nyssa sinensis]|uniref:C2H2-type domain-containing protein n=1 Tax=Nyssa sinensis TaxID=561372 RepID=A0A5J5C505_9ASTE|nr:hypothetical protein F0562_001913 [Nyssa sinensis]
MEFWGVEVKAGEPLMVKPEDNKLIHISQASLGEGKKDKGNDSVPLHLKIDGKKFVLGTLSAAKSPQLTFDLVFEKEFELSHDWKNGSVYFLGYQADSDDGEDEDGFDFLSHEDEDEEEDLPVLPTENGKLEPKVEKVKPATNKGNTAKPASSAKPKVTLVEPKKDDESGDDDDEEDDSDDEEDSDDVDEDMLHATDDSSDDEESDDEDEETPKKPDQGKKRPTESATKTPVPAKKAKLATPQKTDGKKGGGHTATPHPSKKAEKTPTSSGKLKEQSPKSGSQVSCNSCSKTFNSGKALESHSKAKHGGK